MTGPIKPSEVGLRKALAIPSAVFEAFNEEIAIRYAAGVARVRQSEIVDRLVAKGLDRREIFDAGWLNVEAAYHEVGWEVEYDRPGYNEAGDAYFQFRKVK